MIQRKFWLNRIEESWKERPILWLSGVRRAGKTVLSQSLPRVEYFDCELPTVRKLMADPEKFLKGTKGKRLVLDEIHRLDNPSELLKIAADHYPSTKILATGSSSLSASVKFKDTLAGRKFELRLTPMTSEDLKGFGRTDLKHRLLFGGLPPFFLKRKLSESDFQEWMDAYWAKDIQELFRLERKNSFQKFLELLMVQSGGIFEANKFANPCEVSRPTIANYLAVLEETYVAHVIRPYSTYRKTEIVTAPKVYMFDTGFICYYRGLYDLKNEDMGLLWEHYVLNELQAHTPSKRIHYWRDKQGNELDFVIAERGKPPIAIECKWSRADIDPAGFKAFRKIYPKGRNFIVASDIETPTTKHYGDLKTEFVPLPELIEKILGRM